MASIDGGGNGDSGGDAAASGEEALLDWVECVREQGVDIADPQVDADGNLVLNPGALQGPEGDQTDAADHGAFRDDLEAAQEVCGEPPEDAVAGFDHGGDTDAEHADKQLAYARCMRDEGFDVPDPDPSGESEREPELDFDDPAVQAADQQCRQEVFGADAPSRGGGGGHGG